MKSNADINEYRKNSYKCVCGNYYVHMEIQSSIFEKRNNFNAIYIYIYIWHVTWFKSQVVMFFLGPLSCEWWPPTPQVKHKFLFTHSHSV